MDPDPDSTPGSGNATLSFGTVLSSGGQATKNYIVSYIDAGKNVCMKVQLLIFHFASYQHVSSKFNVLTIVIPTEYVDTGYDLPKIVSKY